MFVIAYVTFLLAVEVDVLYLRPLMNKKMILTLVGVVFFIAGLLVGVRSVNASEPVCLMKGYVQLDYVTGDWIEGKVGDKEVGFAYYQGFIYGDVDGKQASLNVMRNDTVRGKVGDFQVTWYTDGTHIFGFQPCLRLE